MSTTTSTRVRDLRTGWRRTLALIVPVPAALIAAEMALAPYGLFASPAERLAAASNAPGRVEFVAWLVLASLLLCMPAAMAAAWVVRRSAPRLALAGGTLTVVAFGMSIAMPSSELLVAATARTGTDDSTFEKVAAAVEGHPMVGVATIVFLVGQAVGLLLLGLALWRTIGAPRWAAVVLGASGMLHIALSFNGIAAALSWGATALGFAGASIALWRQTNDEFDLPPTGVVAGSTPSRVAGTASAAPDVRRASQWLLALTAPIVAVAVGWLRFVLPYNTLDTPDQAFNRLVADPTFTTAQVWFGLLTPLAVSGVVAVLWLTRRRVPLLATIAGALSVLGYIALTAADSATPVLVDLVAHGQLDTESVRPIAAALEAMPQPTAGVSVFVLGHLLGTILLGIALWRSRVLPAWVGILLVVSQPVHLLSAMTGNHPLDLAAWGATAVCMGIAGIAALRMPPSEFDLPPLSARPVGSGVGAPAGLPAHG